MHRPSLLLTKTVAILFCAPSTLLCQVPSGTDIFLVAVNSSEDVLNFGTPTNVTDRVGYDNQPSFVPDGSAVLFTSNHGGQTDIYRYVLATSSIHVVAGTRPESEYSPKVMPSGEAYSVIRVEADSTQRLWQFQIDGTNPSVVLPDIEPVGYHAWGDEHTVGVFVLGSPATFQIADIRTGDGEVIASDIGRSIHKIPGRHAISFTHRTPDMWVKEFDLDSHEVSPLVQLLESEFYAWLPDGTILTGQGSMLFRWSPHDGTEWEEVADFTGTGIEEISRIAVSPRGDMLAIVSTR